MLQRRNSISAAIILQVFPRGIAWMSGGIRQAAQEVRAPERCQKWLALSGDLGVGSRVHTRGLRRERYNGERIVDSRAPADRYTSVTHGVG